MSFPEKLAAGQMLLTSGTLEDVIVLFRQNQQRSLDFVSYVLSGKWVNLVNLDEVKGIYDEDFVFEMEPVRAEYHFATGSGYLLKNYIFRHSLPKLNLHSVHHGEKWESPQPKEGVEFIDETDSDTVFSNQHSPSTIAPNELPEQFLPLLLVRILSVYLRQAGKAFLVDTDSNSTCSTGAYSSAKIDMSLFDLDKCTLLQQEQYLYFHALSLRSSDILGITLTTGWMAKIRRVINHVNLAVCICKVRNTSTAESNTRHSIVYANDAYCAMHHCTMETVLSGHSDSFYHSERTESEQVRLIQHALSHGVALKVAVNSHTKNGEALANMLALRPIFDGNGVYTYIVSVQYDLYQHGGKNNILADLNRVECVLSLLEETMML